MVALTALLQDLINQVKVPICSANLQVQPGWTLLNTEAMEAIPAENTGPRSVLSRLAHSLEGDGAETKMKTPFLYALRSFHLLRPT